MFEIPAFYFFSIVSIVLFAISVFSKNVLYAMTSLAGGMVFLSGLYFTLGADFLGVLQIIVYVGAILVLYGFAVMIFDVSRSIKERGKSAFVYILAFFSIIMLLFIFSAPFLGENLKSQLPIMTDVDNIKFISMVIFTKYILLFEAVAIMLLVAMISAIVLVHKDMNKSLTLDKDI